MGNQVRTGRRRSSPRKAQPDDTADGFVSLGRRGRQVRLIFELPSEAEAEEMLTSLHRQMEETGALHWDVIMDWPDDEEWPDDETR